MNPTRLSREQFIARFGGVYEHSPHFAAAVWDAGAATGPAEALYDAFRRAVEDSGENAQLALVRAHPDLANRVAMSKESTNEQIGAGLDACTTEEFNEFQRLNDEYKRKFDFPFIMAVRGLDRAHILATFRNRLKGARDDELRMALDQIHRIAALRLNDILTGA